VSGTKLYVVMEYAPFGELKYYIEKAQRAQTPFPEECVWRLFLQLAKCVMWRAVCAAHADVHFSVVGLHAVHSTIRAMSVLMPRAGV
jgi:serine/threonine protein kinase